MDKRTIDELVTLYELEPSVKDIFVEGPTDQAFVATVVAFLGLDDVQVYDVEAVEVPVPVLRTFGLTFGKRQQVIALALVLERDAPVPLDNRVCCIADADTDAGIAPAVTGRLLLYTDWTSMMLYAYEPATIQRYLDQVVLGFPASGSDVLTIIEPVLAEAALSRRANTKMALNTAPVHITNDCTVSGSAVMLDVERFTTRFLNKANAMSRRAEYEGVKGDLASTLAGDPRLWVHGEDFLVVFHWLIVRLRGSGRTVPSPYLDKVLLLAVPPTDVAKSPLFAELRRRLA